MSVFRTSQFRFVFLILATWLGIFFLTRGVLLAAHWTDAQAGVADLLHVFGIGLVYDVGFLLYAAIPLALYALLCPNRLWRMRWHQAALKVLFGVSVFVMLFTAVAEWVFWDEFGVRFNFIAVDYLVYSKEVVSNILESYPVFRILGVLVLLAVVVAIVQRQRIRAILDSLPLMSKSASLAAVGGVVSLGVLSAFVLGQDFPRGLGGNAYQNELASNGPFQFFAAFRNNELDYRQFYATLPGNQVAELLRNEVAEPNARFIGSDPQDIRRVVDNPGTPRQLNVILVTIESLSAKHLGSFGDKHGLTPNLDKLRNESLVFSNFYATGTRTDRGLEAITLSIPPTPGRSIVKRIGRESGYASLGQQFNAQGYDSVFLYGGRGYFDNMNAFFGGNGYRIVDQSSVPDSEMTFKNAWGMSDEDLYRQATKVADADHAAGKPFFLQLMTTSNHRPYTYPNGRIDIPSGQGREGAVKYTDHAIGEFLAEARKKPWFDKTVFVFVADHTAGSAGKEDLPVANYHIPLFIYAPSVAAPRDITTVASQIDVAPTLLGLLNFDYTSSFFGHNLLAANPPAGRAVLGNYQHLGLFDGTNLAILSPRKATRRHDDALGNSREVAADLTDPLVQRDIAYYQGASHDFRNGLLAWRPDATAVTHLTATTVAARPPRGG